MLIIALPATVMFPMIQIDHTLVLSWSSQPSKKQKNSRISKDKVKFQQKIKDFFRTFKVLKIFPVHSRISRTCADPAGLGLHTEFYERHSQLFSELPYFRAENAWSRTKHVLTHAYTLQPVILYQRCLLWLDEALRARDYSGFGRLFQGKVGLHSYSSLPQNWQIKCVFWIWITIPE